MVTVTFRAIMIHSEYNMQLILNTSFQRIRWLLFCFDDLKRSRNYFFSVYLIIKNISFIQKYAQ